MAESVFRKKSIDRISTPENLNEYIRVPNPGIWLILSAIIIFLIGICVWGAVGRLDTKLNCAAISQNGATVLYVCEDKIEQVCVGQIVDVDGARGTVTGIDSTPVCAVELDSFVRHILDVNNDEWVYVCSSDVELPDGLNKAYVLLESISPMYFILN